METTDYLDQKHLDYRVLTHKPTYTAQRLAAEEHVPGMNVVKPVVIIADGQYYLCALPACCRVDLDKLYQYLDAKNIRLATEEEMVEIFTDCEVGAEPPIGDMFGLPTLMDQSLVGDQYIIFQAGTHEKAVQLKMTDFQATCHPRVLDYSYHLH